MLTLRNNTLSEGVACKSRCTNAVWSMADNSTFCIDATWSWAWILAFEIDASQMTSTFSIAYTFWSAVWRRPSKIRQTRTWWTVLDHLACSIGSTRWRLTRICRWSEWRCSCTKIIYEWIFLTLVFLTVKITADHYYKFKNDIKVSLHMGWHLMKGLPVSPGGQLQIGLWLLTWHQAPTPQVPGQGSLHFWFAQASLRLQSELTTHSGLQDGGLPMNPGTHEHTACSLMSRHWLLGPQGDGLHGCFTTAAEVKKEEEMLLINLFRTYSCTVTEINNSIQFKFKHFF